ncbi:MAG: hypothetical protein IT366_24470 [Candidatus Hydrogenedentes bacterium]|nr:hypothetical protein [Candidatus Hydrogenedentota bacterium]
MGFWKGFVAGGLAVALGFGAGFFSRVSADSDVLVARELRIVDPAGKVVGKIGWDEDDGVRMQLGQAQDGLLSFGVGAFGPMLKVQRGELAALVDVNEREGSFTVMNPKFSRSFGMGPRGGEAQWKEKAK